MNTHNTLAEDIYREKADDLKLSAISFPGKGESSFAEGTDSEIRGAVVNKADALLHAEYPLITLSDYRLFSRTGNRVIFEEKYFARRRMLTMLCVAECLEGKGRYTDRILDGLYLILDETTWCLPAHNTCIRDAKPLEIPDPQRPVIDLFAAETAAIVGLAESVLREQLKRISPVICERVESEIEKRIVTPYLSYHFWWMGNGEESMCNWTPWITQNVLLAVFSREDGHIPAEKRRAVLQQAVKSIDYFLDEYGEDGCCDEGAQYYSHAGLCLFGCIDVLDRITDGAFRYMYDDTLVRNIASYIRKMYVGDGYYINYADCSPFPGRRGVRDYLFAVNTHNEAYAVFASEDYRQTPAEDRIEPEEENLYYHLLQLMYHGQMMKHTGKMPQAEDCYFESTGVLIARDEHFTLAVKAGDNGDSHNHNDVGSITLYRDSRPFLIDLGVETYTEKTFSKERYSIWTMQSMYHNTVSFAVAGGGEAPPAIAQHDGEGYAASDVAVSLFGEEASISFEMAGAYDDDRIRSCRRTVKLIKGKEIILEDSFDTDPELRPVLTFMLYDRPEISESEEITDIEVSGLGRIRACGIARVVVETCPVNDERLRTAWKHECYRLLLYVRGDSARTLITL